MGQHKRLGAYHNMTEKSVKSKYVQVSSDYRNLIFGPSLHLLHYFALYVFLKKIIIYFGGSVCVFLKVTPLKIIKYLKI